MHTIFFFFFSFFFFKSSILAGASSLNNSDDSQLESWVSWVASPYSFIATRLFQPQCWTFQHGISPSMKNLSKLEDLYLHNNLLAGEIPSWLFDLKSLEETV